MPASGLEPQITRITRFEIDPTCSAVRPPQKSRGEALLFHHMSIQKAFTGWPRWGQVPQSFIHSFHKPWQALGPAVKTGNVFALVVLS